MPKSIFLDFTLPNAPTWFYLSAILAVALFFRFNRILSLRNWDLISLFLLVPGLLLLKQEQFRAAASGLTSVPPDRLWWGYLWLLSGSAYLFVRCMIDLALVRRPALDPNLNRSGLAWMTGTLFVCLAGVALAQSRRLRRTRRQGQHRARKRAKRRGGAGDANGRRADRWPRHTLLGRTRTRRACHLAVVGALLFIGWRHFQDLSAGMSAATLYLLLPYIAFYVEQINHVWPVALLLWAIACYKHPIASGLLVGLASGSSIFPFLTLPVWLSFYWRRGAKRFGISFAIAAGFCLAAAALLLWLEGQLADNIRNTLGLSDWQPWRSPDAPSFWSGVHAAYRIPLFLLFAIFVFITAIWPRPKDLAHLIALNAAILIGIQFWYADRGGEYILWYLPLVLLLVFRPNLSERIAPPIDWETDGVSRWTSAVRNAAGSVTRRFRPPARVGS